MEPRPKSGLSIKALVRRCDLAAIGVAMVARGNPDAGAILINPTVATAAYPAMARPRCQPSRVACMFPLI